MAKKWLAFLLVAAMALTLVACGGTASSPSTPAQASSEAPAASTPADASNTSEPADAASTPAADADYSGYKVALLLPGSINDSGWNSAGYSGLMHLKDKFGVETAYSEAVSHSDQEEYIRNYALQGYNIIIGHSTSFVDSVKKVAPDFPDVYFFTTNAGEDYVQEPNVACFGAVDSGYLAGLVAGCLTDSNTVGVLGGETSPSITPIVERYIDGAKYANPDVEVLNGYIGSLVDADKAKEMATSYISQGADVVCVSADAAGLGVLQAADQEGVYAVGFNADQYDVAPDAVVVSVIRDFPRMFENSFLKVVDGTFEPIVYSYGIAEGGTSLTDWHGWDEKLPAEKVEKLNQILDDIQSGAIVVE